MGKVGGGAILGTIFMTSFMNGPWWLNSCLKNKLSETQQIVFCFAANICGWEIKSYFCEILWIMFKSKLQWFSEYQTAKIQINLNTGVYLIIWVYNSNTEHRGQDFEPLLKIWIKNAQISHKQDPESGI